MTRPGVNSVLSRPRSPKCQYRALALARGTLQRMPRRRPPASIETALPMRSTTPRARLFGLHGGHRSADRRPIDRLRRAGRQTSSTGRPRSELVDRELHGGRQVKNRITIYHRPELGVDFGCRRLPRRALQTPAGLAVWPTARAAGRSAERLRWPIGSGGGGVGGGWGGGGSSAQPPPFSWEWQLIRSSLTTSYSRLLLLWIEELDGLFAVEGVVARKAQSTVGVPAASSALRVTATPRRVLVPRKGFVVDDGQLHFTAGASHDLFAGTRARARRSWRCPGSCGPDSPSRRSTGDGLLQAFIMRSVPVAVVYR